MESNDHGRNKPTDRSHAFTTILSSGVSFRTFLFRAAVIMLLLTLAIQTYSGQNLDLILFGYVLATAWFIVALASDVIGGILG